MPSNRCGWPSRRRASKSVRVLPRTERPRRAKKFSPHRFHSRLRAASVPARSGAACPQQSWLGSGHARLTCCGRESHTVTSVAQNRMALPKEKSLSAIICACESMVLAIHSKAAGRGSPAASNCATDWLPAGSSRRGPCPPWRGSVRTSRIARADLLGSGAQREQRIGRIELDEAIAGGDPVGCCAP
jgi:hypothetical protein